MKAEQICNNKTTITLESLEVLDFIHMLQEGTKEALKFGMPSANLMRNIYSDFCNMVENAQ